MLAQHSDDVLERMQVLRESQVALVSENTGGDWPASRRVVCEFSLENEVCALSIMDARRYRGQSVHLVSIVSSGGDVTRDEESRAGRSRFACSRVRALRGPSLRSSTA